MTPTRPGRLRTGLAVLLTGLATVSLSTAAAHAVGDPVDPPDPPTPTSDYTISGTVSLVRCSTVAANVKVLAHGITFPFLDKSVVAKSVNGTIKYTIGSLPRGTYSIKASTINGACPYGDSSVSLASSPAGSNPKSTANVTYYGPHGTKVISGATVASVFNANFSTMSMVLNNYRALHPVMSRQSDSASFMAYPGGYAGIATIPEVVDTWEGFIFKMYSHVVHKNGNSTAWNNGGIDLTLKFETEDDEIKYLAVVPPLYDQVYYDDYDHNLTNIKVKLRLLPVVNSSGQLTYSLSGAAVMTATAADTCQNVEYDPDPCDIAKAMWQKVMDNMAKAVDTMMNNPPAKSFTAAGVATLVPAAQQGHLTKVIVRNGDIVLVW